MSHVFQILTSSWTLSCERVFFIRRAVSRAAPLAYQHSRMIFPITLSACGEKTNQNEFSRLFHKYACESQLNLIKRLYFYMEQSQDGTCEAYCTQKWLFKLANMFVVNAAPLFEYLFLIMVYYHHHLLKVKYVVAQLLQMPIR